MKIKIDVEIYSSTVIVVTTFDEFKKLHKSAENDVEFVTTEYGQHIYVLVSDLWDSMYDHRFIQGVSHELNHAAMCLLNYMGVNFDYQNQEALCYLQDYLIGKVFKEIKKSQGVKNEWQINEV